MRIATVITTYNSGAYLEEALASVFAQTQPPDEIIVIDDGSTDDTPARMQRWAGRVQYRWQENVGGSASRNIGWKATNAEWIAFLDADDLWLPDRLEKQKAWVEAHPEVEAVFGLAQNFAQAGCEAMFDAEKHRLDRWVPGWLPSAALVRREVLVRTGGFDGSLRSSDTVDWLIRLREAGVAVAMPEIPIVRRRLHGRNNRLTSGKPMSNDLRILRGFIARKRARAEQDSRP